MVNCKTKRGFKVKAKDRTHKWTLFLALAGSLIMFITLFLTWLKFEHLHGIMYFTGLELMLDHGVLAPFLALVSGTFGIIGILAMMRRANVIGPSIVLAAGLLAIFGFLHWISSNVFLRDGVIGGGGQMTKMVTPLLLLVGVGCFALPVARKIHWHRTKK